MAATTGPETSRNRSAIVGVAITFILIVVVLMGIALASQTRVSVRHVLEFNETLRIVFISGLFVLLGVRLAFMQRSL